MDAKPTSAPAHQPPDLSSLCLAMIEHSPLPMATVEGAGHIMRCVNPAFCRLMDKPTEELVGKPFCEMLPEKDECLTLLDRVYRTGKPESHTEQDHSRPQPLFWSFTMWPVLANERPVGVMIQVTETTQVHEKTLAMNEALILGAVRQHELAEAAESSNVELQKEIAERERAESLVNFQRQALQLLAEDATLESVLQFLIGVVERETADGMLASIVPLNDAETHFQRGIGVSLPDAFNVAVEGVAVGSPSGLCANAVRAREPVAVHDFNKGTQWQAFAQFVAPYGLRSGWSVPIISSSGRMLGTFANYYRRVGDPTPPNRELVDVVVRTAAIAIERKRAEEAKRDTLARFQILADNMPALCWMANPEGGIFWYNRRWYEYTGTTPQSQEGWGWQSVHDPKTLPAVMERWQVSIATGQPFEMVFPLKGADGVFRPFLTRIVPLRDEEGRIVQWFGTNTDITNERKAEERQQLLMNELAHRSKNLLAVIQGIASRSLSGTRPLAEAREVLMQRIQALARSQSVLITEGFEGAPVTDIIRLEFEAFSERVKAAGPEVMLNPRAAQTFTLFVHELATNATKHGALSKPRGRIAIQWSIEGAGADATFKFQWQERDGPPVVPPTRQGFGRILLEKAVAQEFGAPPKIRFAPEGLSYEIEAPLSVVAADSAPRGGDNS